MSLSPVELASLWKQRDEIFMCVAKRGATLKFIEADLRTEGVNDVLRDKKENVEVWAGTLKYLMREGTDWERMVLKLYHLDRGEPLPVDLKGRAIYYVGPVDPIGDEVVGPAGPTTSTDVLQVLPEQPAGPCRTLQLLRRILGDGSWGVIPASKSTRCPVGKQEEKAHCVAARHV